MSIKRFSTRNLLATAFVVSIVSIVGMTGLTLRAGAHAGPSWGPEWTAAGDLVLPQGYHEWVFLGSPLTPNALNDGQAGFPEYHNVYVQPEPLKVYRGTGEWPEGTILLKELQLTLPGENSDGSRLEASGRGFFPSLRRMSQGERQQDGVQQVLRPDPEREVGRRQNSPVMGCKRGVSMTRSNSDVAVIALLHPHEAVPQT